jgi:hypothetical protein
VHGRTGIRPRLTRVVHDLLDDDAGLLVDFAPDGVLE